MGYTGGPPTLTDEQILQITLQYIKAQERATELVKNTEEEIVMRVLTGAAGSIYLKRKGHRPLSATDIEKLIGQLGTDVEKRAVKEFPEAQRSLSGRLAQADPIGLVIKQVGMLYDTYYTRLNNPSRWKTEEITKVIDVLGRLRI